MKKFLKKSLFVASFAAAVPCFSSQVYSPTWESLDSRPVPSWWTEAKFGIFVHWGPYAVPAFGNVTEDGKFAWDCYAEWYHGFLLKNKKSYVEHHRKFYHGAPYGNFAAQFKAEHFDASQWAKLFKKAGARYAVLTSKHHDGYVLWPSSVTPYYNSVALGSGRDLAGEFCKAMREAGLKRGFYFSMLEYANPLYPALRDGKPAPSALTPEEWNRRVNLPQLKELAENYEADIIWPDGEWDYPSERHCSKEYLAWLYNESKVKDTVVVNDRWGRDCRGRHGGHYTTEYLLEGGDASGDVSSHPWEECRGIGNSFGYSRFETPKDDMTRERCVETLVSCVSRGGNLLLNVGPTADGRIPAIMQDRLLAIGRWLDVNGEAIYGTTCWSAAPKDFVKRRIYFTRKADAVYMIVFATDRSTVAVPGLTDVKGVSMLGTDAKVSWKTADGALKVEIPRFAPGASPVEFAPVFKIVRQREK